jgi:conjugative relaxase-like TrwC/TraI family protein
MLTYRTGAVGGVSGGKAMAAHLLEATLPREAADLARYYQAGAEALSGTDLALRNIARHVMEGTLSPESAELLIQEKYLADLNVAAAAAPPKSEQEERIRSFGELLAHGWLAYSDIERLWQTTEGRRMRLAGAEEGDIDKACERYTSKVVDAALAYEARAQNIQERGVEFAKAKLDELIRSIERGEQASTTAEPRADMHPRLAARLGIDPCRSLSAEELANLLAGRRTDGREIDGASKPKTISFVDCCFSADKSVSLAWAFAPTEAERNQIVQAHRDAVQSAMAYVSEQLGQARKGNGGKDGYEPGHVGWAQFTHYTSRPTLEIANGAETELVSLKVAGDPNLHTHVTMFNAVLTDTGRLGSLDLQRLEGRVHEFGAYYQAHLAQNLRSIGAEVVLDQETGAAKLTAIPDAVRAAFSKRTMDANTIARRWAAEQGQDWDAMSAHDQIVLAKQGASIGRQSKNAKRDDLSDFTAWRQQADKLGWRHAGVLRHGVAPAEQTRELRIEQAYGAALPFIEKAFAKSAVIDMAELRAAATRGLIAASVSGPGDISEVVRTLGARGVRQEGDDTQLIAAKEGRKARVTTAKHVGAEEELVSLATAAAMDRTAALPKAAIERAISRSDLDLSSSHGEQQRAIIEQLGAGGRLGVAIGVAGAGKTALLSVLADAWKEDGRTVLGAAIAWRQADDLADAGIENRYALSVLLDRAEAGKLELNRKSVIVVDELGLVGTSDMARLLRLQAASGAQIIAVGDHRQCQSVEAGPVIELLRKALGPDQIPELLTTVRQQTARERETSLLFRDGEAGKALARKDEDATLELVPGGYRDAVARVADLWAERRAANAADPSYRLIVTAPTNEDARAISAAIRERRRAAGELAPDAITVKATDQNGAEYDLAVARGDRVRLFANTGAALTGGRAGNIGRNGSVLTVLDISAEGVRLRNAKGTEGLVKWQTLQEPLSGRVRLSYGDCLTINSAQGITATEHINALPGGSRTANANTVYVAESRHRRQSWLVTSDGAERQEISSRRPLGDARPITRNDVIANMARNLSRQLEKPSAIMFLERAAEAMRQSARGLQSGLRPAEERRNAGQQPTTLHRTYARERMRAAARAVHERVIRPAMHAVSQTQTQQRKPKLRRHV